MASNKQMVSSAEQAVRRLQVLDAVHEIAKEINARPQTRPLVRGLIKRAQDVLNPHGGVTIYLNDLGDSSLRVADALGINEQHSDVVLAPGEGLAGKVVQARQTIIVEDYIRWEGRSMQYEDANMRHALSTPLIWRGDVLGVLALTSGPDDPPYSDDDVELAEIFAEHAALAIGTALLFESGELERGRSRALMDVSRALTSQSAVKVALTDMLVQCQDVIPFRSAMIVAYNGDNVEKAAWHGYSSGQLREESFDRHIVNGKLLKHILKTREPLLLPDLQVNGSEWVADGQELPFQSWLGVPLLRDGEHIGTMMFDGDSVGQFNTEHLELAQVLAGQVAVALANTQLYEIERGERQRTNILLNIASTLVSGKSQHEVLEYILEESRKIIPYTTGGIAVYEGETPVDFITSSDYHEYNSILSTETVVKTFEASALMARMIKEREPIVVADVTKESGWVQEPGNDHIASWMSIPLVAEGEFLGALMFDSNKRDTYSEHHVEIAKALAAHASVALKNVRLYESEYAARQRADSLREFILDLSSTLSLDEVLDGIMAQARQFIPYTSGSIILTQGSEMENLHKIYGFEGISDEAKRELKSIASKSPLLKRVGKNKKPIVIGNVREDKDWIPQELFENIHSWMGIPLWDKKKIIGYITFDNEGVDTYTQKHAEIAETMGVQAVTAIKNARLFEAEQAAREQADVLRDIVVALSSTLSLDEVLDRIMQQAARLIPYVSGSMVIFTEGRPPTIKLAGFDDVPENMADIFQKMYEDQSLIKNHLLGSGDVIIVEDVKASPDWVEIDELDASHIRGWMAIPIEVDAQTRGRITFDSDMPGVFTQHHAEFGKALAAQAVVAIRNARLYEAEQSARERAGVLQEIALTLNTTLSLQDVLENIMQQANRLIPYEAGSIILFQDDNTAFIKEIGLENGAQTVTSSVLPLNDESIATLAALDDIVEPVILPDKNGLLEWKPDSQSIRSMLVVPLISEGTLLGRLGFGAKDANVYSAEHVEVAKALGEQAVTAIRNARLFEAEHEARRHADAMRDTTTALASTLNLDDVLGLIMAEAAELIPYKTGTAQLVIDDEVIVRLFGYEDTDETTISAIEQVRKTRTRLDNHLFKTGKPMRIPDVRDSDIWEDDEGVEHIRSWMGIPLLLDGEPLGILTFDSVLPDTYTAEHARAAAALGAQAVVAIRNARLFNETQSLLQQVENLFQASYGLINANNYLDLLEIVSKPAFERSAAEASLWYLGGGSGTNPEWARCVSYTSSANVVPIPVVTHIELGDREHTFLDNLFSSEQAGAQLVSRADAEQESVYHNQLAEIITRRKLGAMLFIPLRNGDRRVGLLVLGWPEEVDIPQEELRFYNVLSPQVGAIFENRSLFEQTRKALDQTEALYSASQRMINARLEYELLEAITESEVFRDQPTAVLYYIDVQRDSNDDKVIMARTAARVVKNKVNPPEEGEVYAVQDFAIGKSLLENPTRNIYVESVAQVSPEEDPRLHESLIEGNTDGLVLIPLTSHGERWIGLLSLSWDQPMKFSEQQKQFLTVIGSQLAALVDNRRLLLDTQEALDRSEELYTASQLLLAAQNEVDLLSAFMQSSVIPKEGVTGTLYIVNPQDILGSDDAVWGTVAAYVDSRDATVEPRIPEQEMTVSDLPIVQYLFDDPSQMLVIEDRAELDPESELVAFLRSRHVEASVLLPLISMGNLWVGLLELTWDRPITLSQQQRQFIGVLAPELASIIESRQLLQETRQAQKRFEDITLSTSDGVWEMDTDGVLTYCSENLAVSLGYALIDLLGHSFGELLTLLDFEDQAVPLLLRWARSQPVIDYEVQLSHADDSIQYHMLSAVPVANQRGELMGYRGVLKNIQAQKEAELRENVAFEVGQRLTSVLSMDELKAFLSTQLADLLGHERVYIRFYDPQANELLLYDDEDNVIERISLDSDEVEAQVACNLRAIAQNDVNYYEEDVDGYIRSEASFPLSLGNRLLGTMCVTSKRPSQFVDAEMRTLQNLAAQISIAVENARLYQALEVQAESLEEEIVERTGEILVERERMRGIVESAGEGIIFTGVDGLIEYVNPAWEQLTGYSAAEVTGRYVLLQDLLRMMEPNNLVKEMVRHIGARKGWRGELTIVRPDASQYDAAFTISPVENVEGKVRRFVTVMRDITAQKEVERMRRKFVANVSHELRTPLANLKLYNTLLRSGAEEKREHYLDTVSLQLGRLERLVEDLLDISRIDRGIMSMLPQRISLNRIVDEVLRAHELMAEERGLELHVLKASTLPMIFADRERMMQVLTNLLANAINYSQEGDQIRIQTRATRHNGVTFAALVVSDTGVGIAADDLPFIFNRFFRAENSKVTGVPGTGLGLSIVKEIVELHGGEIFVESIQGLGTTFTILLPTSQQEAKTEGGH